MGKMLGAPWDGTLNHQPRIHPLFLVGISWLPQFPLDPQRRRHKSSCSKPIDFKYAKGPPNSSGRLAQFFGTPTGWDSKPKIYKSSSLFRCNSRENLNSILGLQYLKKTGVYTKNIYRYYSCSLPEPEAASYNSGEKECIHHIYFKSMECIHLCNPSQTTAPLPEPLSWHTPRPLRAPAPSRVRLQNVRWLYRISREQNKWKHHWYDHHCHHPHHHDDHHYHQPPKHSNIVFFLKRRESFKNNCVNDLENMNVDSKSWSLATI